MESKVRVIRTVSFVIRRTTSADVITGHPRDATQPVLQAYNYPYSIRKLHWKVLFSFSGFVFHSVNRGVRADVSTGCTET